MRRIVHLVYLLVVCTACTRPVASTDLCARVVLATAPSTLDPRSATDAYGMRINQLLFNSLVRVGSDLRPEGDAATHWQIAGPDYTFHLRSGLSFSNGRALQSADLDFSFASYSKPGQAFATALENVEKWESFRHADHLDVLIRLKKPNPQFLISDLPSLKILPAEELQSRPEEFLKSLWGTGNFKWVGGNLDSIRLQARTDVAKPPQIPCVEFKVVRDDFTRFQKLARGELDISANEMSAIRLPYFAQKPERFGIFKGPGLSMTYVLVNFRKTALQERDLRQSLISALDREQIVNTKLEGYAQTATSLLSPATPYFQRDLQNPEFAPDRAAQWIHQHKPKSLTLTVSNSPAALDTAKVLVRMWRKVGFEVQLKSYEWGTFYSDINHGRFDLAVMRWVGALDPDLYRTALHSREFPPGRNRGYFANAKLDQLLDEGRDFADESLRKKHYQKVQELVLSELAILPLWYEQNVWVVSQRVENFHGPVTGDYRFLNDIRLRGSQ